MTDGRIITSPTNDEAQRLAAQQARNTFRFFWRELSWEYRRIIPGLQFAAVKLGFATDGGAGTPSTELMWFNDVHYDGTTVSGTLLNQPQWTSGYAAGDRVEREAAAIADWMYATGGLVFGGFTVNAIRRTLGPQELEAHDAAWGLDFGDPHEQKIAPPVVRGPDGSATWATDGSRPWPGVLELEAMEHPMSLNMRDKVVEGVRAQPQVLTDADAGGLTMLHSEALAGNATPVEVLLEAGADPTLRTARGETALDLARRHRWPLVIAALEAAG